MKKFYIEPKTIYIDFSLEEPINGSSNVYGEEGGEEEYTKQQNSSNIWNSWDNTSDK